MQTEELILEKTFRLLLEKGFDATSISDIQKATQLSRGLLYHYFKSKDDLFVRVTEKYFIEIFDFEVYSVSNNDVLSLIDFICNRLAQINFLVNDINSKEGFEKVSGFSYNLLLYQVARADTKFKTKYNKIIDKELIAWKLSLKNSIDKGELASSIDIDAAARQFLIITNGIWYDSFSEFCDNKIIISNLKKSLLYQFELLRKVS